VLVGITLSLAKSHAHTPSLAATSFCKCTCFSNSTIIPLTDLPGESTAKKATCNDCNRQFCLSYNLPICKDAKDADVFTTCFQRDSTKDQMIVYTFILVTCGLLIWAAVKPYAETYLEVCGLPEPLYTLLINVRNSEIDIATTL
jgi:hypothetical protein